MFNKKELDHIELALKEIKESQQKEAEARKDYFSNTLKEFKKELEEVKTIQKGFTTELDKEV